MRSHCLQLMQLVADEIDSKERVRHRDCPVEQSVMSARNTPGFGTRSLFCEERRRAGTLAISSDAISLKDAARFDPAIAERSNLRAADAVGV
jgi:hypothetical protein